MKAVNYDGEMFIIEEVQVFQHRESIKILKFSIVTVISNCLIVMLNLMWIYWFRNRMLIKNRVECKI